VGGRVFFFFFVFFGAEQDYDFSQTAASPLPQVPRDLSVVPLASPRRPHFLERRGEAFFYFPLQVDNLFRRLSISPPLVAIDEMPPLFWSF